MLAAHVGAGEREVVAEKVAEQLSRLDRAFEGDDELVKRGFLIARNALRPYIA